MNSTKESLDIRLDYRLSKLFSSYSYSKIAAQFSYKCDIAFMQQLNK